MKNFLIALVVSIFFLISSCGTILKWNQVYEPHSGQLDIAVLSLDIAGLFLFLVPGIVFLTVDYHTGTLFLPKVK